MGSDDRQLSVAVLRRFYSSGLWGHWEALAVLVALMVFANEYGEVDMIHAAIAHATSLPPAVVDKGLAILQTAEVIEPLDEARGWGWRVNSPEFEEQRRRVEARRAKYREYQARSRAKRAALLEAVR